MEGRRGGGLGFELEFRAKDIEVLISFVIFFISFIAPASSWTGTLLIISNPLGDRTVHFDGCVGSKSYRGRGSRIRSNIFLYEPWIEREIQTFGQDTLFEMSDLPGWVDVGDEPLIVWYYSRVRIRLDACMSFRNIP